MYLQWYTYRSLGMSVLEDSSCSQSPGLCSFGFMMLQTLSVGERSGLQAGHFSTWTFRSQVVTIKSDVVSEIWKAFPEKGIESEMMLLLNLYIPFCTGGTFPDVVPDWQAANSKAIIVPDTFGNIVYCGWGDIQSHYFPLRNTIMTFFAIYKCRFVADWRTPAHFYFWQTVSL